MNRGKRIWILLLIIQTFFVCEMVVLENTQTSYQTEEDDNVTIRWDTQTKTDLSLTNLYCFFQSETFKVLYQMINGVEDPESQHQQFAGRVQLDRDALREGRVRLHLSTVTAEDSGNYWCDLAADYDNNRRRWGLLATEKFVLSVSRTFGGDNTDVSLNTPKSGPEIVEGSEPGRGNNFKEFVFLTLFILALFATVVTAFGKLLCQDLPQKDQDKEGSCCTESPIGQQTNEVNVDIPDCLDCD